MGVAGIDYNLVPSDSPSRYKSTTVVHLFLFIIVITIHDRSQIHVVLNNKPCDTNNAKVSARSCQLRPFSLTKRHTAIVQQLRLTVKQKLF